MLADETMLPGAGIAGAGPLERVGRDIGDYRLLAPLGEGGFGTVWLAERRHPFVQQVALKIVKAGMDSKAVVARFEQERQALAVMNHPHVAKVIDGGITPQGRPYFAMEYVRGEPITDFCDRHRLTVKERLSLFRQVCEAVQHAHTKGIIHRDLKPSNVLVSMAEDDQPSAKVIDFGVAKAVTGRLTEQTVFTETGQMIGTPEYMSPEQADPGQADIDTRTDVYSLGVILYELLSGALPFDPTELRSRAYGEIQRVIREEDPPTPSARLSTIATKDAALASRIGQSRQEPVSALASLLKSELEWIPLKAMRKDRRERYDSPGDLARDLENYLQGRPLVAAPESTGYRLRKYVRRNRGFVAAASTVLAALVAGLGLATWQYAEARAARTSAIAARDAAVASEAAAVAERDRAESLLGVMTLSKALDAVRRNDPIATGIELKAVEELGLGQRFSARLAQALSDQSIAEPLRGHLGAVYAVAASPDGSAIASASADGSVRLWGVRDRDTRWVAAAAHARGAGAVAFMPDGKSVLSAGWDAKIRAWDAATGEPLGAPVTGHADGVVAIVPSLDGRLVASGSLDGSVRLWNPATWQPVGRPLAGHAGGVWSVALSPDGTILAAGGEDGSVRLWDVGSQAPVGEPMHGHGGPVLALAFAPDGRTVASGSRDGTIRRWDVGSRKASGEPIVGHGNWVTGIAFSADGRTLASGSFDNTIRLWDAATGKPLGEPYRGHGRGVSGIAFCADGLTLASGSHDSTVRLWDVAPARALGEPLAGHEDEVRSVAFSPDGSVVASASLDGTIRIWDASAAIQLGVAIRGHDSAINGISFSPDGRIIASASNDRTIRLWDARSGAAVGGPLQGHGLSVLDVAFSPDGTQLASGSADRTIRLWDLKSMRQSGEPLSGHGGAVHALAFSPDGRLIASASQDSTIRLWDAQSRKQLGDPLKGHANALNDVCFSPDGTTLASCSSDHAILLWRPMDAGRSPQRLLGHGNGVFGLAFSPDGRSLASGAWDSSVRIWDVGTGRQVGSPLEGPENGFLSVAFSPDGSAVAAGSTGGTVRMWNARPYRSRFGDISASRGEAATIRAELAERIGSVGDSIEAVAEFAQEVIGEGRRSRSGTVAALAVIGEVDLSRQSARLVAREARLGDIRQALARQDVGEVMTRLASLDDRDMAEFDARFWNEVAWRAITELPADSPSRDLRRCLAYAKRAVELTAGTDGSVLDTLARAHWELGDREAAVMVQRKAIAAAEAGTPTEAELDSLRRALERYETPAAPSAP